MMTQIALSGNHHFVTYSTYKSFTETITTIINYRLKYIKRESP